MPNKEALFNLGYGAVISKAHGSAQNTKHSKQVNLATSCFGSRHNYAFLYNSLD
jgi:hypothetical protein